MYLDLSGFDSSFGCNEPEQVGRVHFDLRFQSALHALAPHSHTFFECGAATSPYDIGSQDADADMAMLSTGASNPGLQVTAQPTLAPPTTSR